MLEVGEKVFQITHDWGKKSDGSGFYLYEVVEVYDTTKIKLFYETDPSGYRVDCFCPEIGWRFFIPSHTWMRVSDYRLKRIKEVLE
jgi:hypothetical protein